MAPKSDFPPVRACLFDMDGLLLDTEDIYTLCINIVLEKYNKPKLPWSIKAKLQGRPGPDATSLFHKWAHLPISQEDYLEEIVALQKQHFPSTQPLPGVETLLRELGRTRYWDAKAAATNGHENGTNGHENGTNGHATGTNGSAIGPGHRVHIALATSSHESNFKIKSDHLTELFSVFESHRRVLGDDTRIPKGRGKPLPDIYLLALKTINDSLPQGEKPITPEECLVFEDSVPGVEAGRRAGMRVIWCPHPMLKKEYTGREEEVLAGRTGEAGDVDLHQLGEVGDGWAEYLPNLVDFPYKKFGIVVPPVSVEAEECMRERIDGPVVAVDGPANNCPGHTA